MGKWRDLFEASLLPFEDREYGELYEFGPPVTAEQVAAAERAMGVRLPDDLRAMLAEFNGIKYTSEAGRRYGHEPTEFYLDLEEMSVRLPAYLRTVTDPLPPQDHLRRIAFVCNVDGCSELYGLCLEDVAGHGKGEVIRIDHELGVLEACYPSLADFVRHGPAEAD